tara:strand:- start:3958 stop:4152 length:195 start_codon:yes stop_codon:yes gene_type:complete
MQDIQIRKRQLEEDLKAVIDKFHEENKIYKVSYVSVASKETIITGRKNEIHNSTVKVSVNIEVI